MKTRKITIVESKAILMADENIDTDQIIPARFLKRTDREGFGEALFHDLRFSPTGQTIEHFPLNRGDGSEKILVAGRNFGCGSSREHAAWALADYGFVAVVSSFFADIFRNNALNNGVVPIEVSPQFLSKILNSKTKSINLKIDVMKKEITIIESGEKESFPLTAYKQESLINGYDDIDYLINTLDEIERYEQYRRAAY